MWRDFTFPDSNNAKRKPQMDDIIFHNDGGQLKVPGFGYTVDLELGNKNITRTGLPPFRHGVNDFHNERLVVREIAMMAVMDAITDKPRWHEKVFDENIVEKWRTEAIAIPLISPLAWEWCLQELRDKAAFLAEHGFVKTLDTGSVCAKSDSLIVDSLRDELLAGVKPLLDVKAKDWHPNSNEQVLNLVHPSLFPLVYGRTQVLQEGAVGLSDCVESCGQGTVAPHSPVELQHKPIFDSTPRYAPREDVRFSKRFQWLPAEVKFKGSPGCSDVEFTSYINNLHPNQHKELYTTISKVLSKSIPMWNKVLVRGYEGRVPPRIKTWAKIEPSDEPAWFDKLLNDDPESRDPESLAKVEEYLALPDHPDFDSSEDDDEDRAFKDGSWKDDDSIETHEAAHWKFMRIRGIIHPEPGEAYTYEEWKAGKSDKKHDEGYSSHSRINLSHEYDQVDLEKEFRDQGLQVIVKLASVELTPEKPKYDGGNWHLEGMMNEHIVATAIYYYDVENVSESVLDFRMEALLDDHDLRYEQDDHEPLARIFGTESLRQEPAVQNLGTLRCKQGRLLAFPNTLQHRVQPFKLLDSTRAGHRRFLVLWLVDPNYRIASTANVPPQQHHWLTPETVDRVLAKRDMAVELKDMIREHASDYPMSLETAKELRLELMQERTKLMPSVERGFEEYNFCEH